jgi:hypothetical protein
VFGVSTTALLAWQWLVILLAAAGFATLLSKLAVPRAICSLSSIVVVVQLAEGLRPEQLAYALGFWGLYFLRDPVERRRFLGGALFWLSPLAYPSTITCLPILLIGESPAHTAHLGRGVWRRTLPSLAGVLLSLAVCYALVHGRVSEFARVFLAHRAIRVGTLVCAIPLFVESITHYWEWLLSAPLFVAFGAASWFSWRSRARVGVHIARLNGACLLILLMSIALYPERAPLSMGRLWIYPTVVATFVSVAATSPASRLRHLAHPWAVGCTLLVWGWGYSLLGIVVQSRPAASNVERARAEVARTTGRLFVDGAAARYLFDYKLPPGTRSIFFGVAAQGGEIPYFPKDLTWKRESDTWVGARSTLWWVGGLEHLKAEAGSVEWLGVSLHSLPRYSLDLVVLPAVAPRRVEGRESIDVNGCFF